MSAQPQVTITLGRSGQVVKRARPISDFGHSDHGISSSGGNQPVRERLGSNMADSNLYGSQQKKRHRTENHEASSGDRNQNKQIRTNRRIGRNDLRFKLINKSLFQRRDDGEGQSHVDLREKLSRNREISSRSDRRQHLRESRNSGTVRRLPPTRSADDLLHLDSLRKSYSSRAVDERRHRSPDKLTSSSRVLSSPRSYEDLPRALSMRPIDSSRHSNFIKNGVVDSSRTIPSMSKTGLLIDVGKSVVRDPPSGSVMQRSILKPEEPITVSSLLGALGLGKYAILFQAEEIDMTALRQMGDRDLKELGIPMGPRKKILLAVLSQAKQRYW